MGYCRNDRYREVPIYVLRICVACDCGLKEVIAIDCCNIILRKAPYVKFIFSRGGDRLLQ